jgi:hypothetical protein
MGTNQKFLYEIHPLFHVLQSSRQTPILENILLIRIEFKFSTESWKHYSLREAQVLLGAIS